MSSRKISLFGGVLSPYDIREALVGIASAVEFNEETRLEGSSVLVTGPKGDTIRFNLLRSRMPGDRFSRIAFSALAYFRDLDTRHSYAREEVIRRIGEMEMVIGVLIEPGFSGDQDWRWNALFLVAGSAEAMIFDGFSMVAPNGDLILNLDGETEDDFS